MQIITAESKEQAGRLVAEIVANRLHAFADLGVALPTGRTPETMYLHLRSLWERGALPSREATLLQIDEYLGENAKDMRAELEEGIGSIGFAKKIFWDTGASLEQVSKRPQQADLIVLGIGANGHVAFAEPGCPEGLDYYKTELSPETQSQNGVQSKEALTIGISYILRAREIVLLVTGKHKAEILAKALQGPKTNLVPASLIRDHQRLTVVCDKDASSRLQGARKSHKRAIIAIGCRQRDGRYSPSADGRVIEAARQAAKKEAALVILSGGSIQGRETEAARMLQAFPSRVGTPILLEEASDRSSRHIFFVEPLLEALEIEDFTFVTSWWHMPRFWVMNRGSGAQFSSAWDLRGMLGEQRIRNEAAALLWAKADSREAATALSSLEQEKLWQIKGIDNLSDLSGTYSKEEARVKVILALERSPSLFDFDQLIEGREAGGSLLSGSQLLEALN